MTGGEADETQGKPREGGMKSKSRECFKKEEVIQLCQCCLREGQVREDRELTTDYWILRTEVFVTPTRAVSVKWQGRMPT